MTRKFLGVAALFAVGATCGVLMMDGPSEAVAKDDRSTSSWPSAKAVEGSVHEYMEYLHEPTFHRLNEAIAQPPSGEEDWESITSNALILAESGNLLLLRGPSERRDLWVKNATALREAGAALYRAAQEKDFAVARAKYELMITQCNQCHDDFHGGKPNIMP